MTGRPQMTSEWRHVPIFDLQKGFAGRAATPTVLKLEENGKTKKMQNKQGYKTAISDC